MSRIPLCIRRHAPESSPVPEGTCTNFVTLSIGWKKTEITCPLALDDGYDYAWVDTCCIDKKSSAELTEGINSMISWYKASQLCYVYLADHDMSEPNAEISNARWFTRGWTLQELIAPASCQDLRQALEIDRHKGHARSKVGFYHWYWWENPPFN